jgi:deaminated glutathione amidase
MPAFTAACIQLNAQDDLNANLKAAEALVRQARDQGAEFIALPENAFFMHEPGKGKPPGFDDASAQFQALARGLGAWLLIGSIHPPANEGKAWNRSLLINDKGEIAAQYDKIHLFDVTLKDGEHYRESDRMQAGGKLVTAQLPWGTLGMTVCYDLRFPQLYRALAKAGAQILSVPSAFTYTTGKAHWHALNRARAIENGCFVIAPAQCGTHPGNRRTYGHSLIVDPWGAIIAEGPEDTPGIITADIDMDKVLEARAMIPSLKHDREFGM